MSDDTFVAGKARGTGDGLAASTRGRMSYAEMLKQPGTLVGSDGVLWFQGRGYKADATGVLVEIRD